MRYLFFILFLMSCQHQKNTISEKSTNQPYFDEEMEISNTKILDKIEFLLNKNYYVSFYIFLQENDINKTIYSCSNTIEKKVFLNKIKESIQEKELFCYDHDYTIDCHSSWLTSLDNKNLKYKNQIIINQQCQ